MGEPNSGERTGTARARMRLSRPASAGARIYCYS